jgi:hypothetical protein
MNVNEASALMGAADQRMEEAFARVEKVGRSGDAGAIVAALAAIDLRLQALIKIAESNKVR